MNALTLSGIKIFFIIFLFSLKKIWVAQKPCIYIIHLNVKKQNKKHSLPYLEHSLKVLDLQVRWKLKLVAYVTAAFASVRHIHCKNQSFVAECLHSVHNLLRELTVPVQVQLEPTKPVGRCCDNLLHWTCGVCASYVTGVHCLSGWEMKEEWRDKMQKSKTSGFKQVSI